MEVCLVILFSAGAVTGHACAVAAVVAVGSNLIHSSETIAAAATTGYGVGRQAGIGLRRHAAGGRAAGRSTAVAMLERLGSRAMGGSGLKL